MRKSVIIILAFLLMFTLVGCGTNTASQDQNNSQDQGKNQEEQIKMLSLGTHGVGSIVNTMGTGLATVLSSGLSMEVKAIATTGPVEWLPMLNTNEMDLGVLSNWDAQMGREGKSSYDPISGGKGFPLMLITSGHRSINSLLVAEDSGIRKASEVKGKRYVGTIAGSPGITAQGNAFLANQGLTSKDVKMITVPKIGDAVKSLIEGRADVAQVSQGMGVTAELDSIKGARFLSMDNSPEAVRRTQEAYPCEIVKVSPAKGLVGIKEETYMMSYPFYLAGREGLPESMVYNIVKVLWDKNKDLNAINKNLEDWTPENFIDKNFTIPYHPGAVKFYKEKGLWTAEMEQRQQQLLSK